MNIRKILKPVIIVNWRGGKRLWELLQEESTCSASSTVPLGTSYHDGEDKAATKCTGFHIN